MRYSCRAKMCVMLLLVPMIAAAQNMPPVTNADGSTTYQAKDANMNVSITLDNDTRDALEANQRNTRIIREAVAACKPIQVSQPHPLVAGFNITAQVHGIVNGNCKLTQTMPNNSLVTCQFSEAQRKQIAANPSDMEMLMADRSTCVITGH